MSRDAKDRPARPAEERAEAGSGTRSHRWIRERPYRRALWIGLGLSALLHVLLLLLVRAVELGPRTVSPLPARTEAPEGLSVIRFREAPPSPEEASPRRPEQEEEAPRPVEPAAPELPGRAVDVEPEPALTNAERLQPRMADERLWVDFRHPIRPGSITRDRYVEAVDRLRQIVRVWLDSLQLSEEQRRRARDWTFGDGDSRWGISPEGLHLGEVTIPIPFGALFQQGGPLGREAERAVRDLEEIRAQDVRRDVEDVLEERREEMRRRSHEEAERRKKDTTRGGG